MTAALSWLWHAPGSALGHVRNNRILIGKNPKICCNKRMILACWTPLRAANLDYCSLGDSGRARTRCRRPACDSPHQ